MFSQCCATVRAGQLVLLDFGLCSEVPLPATAKMTAAIVNLMNGDFERLITHDAVELGFLPADTDFVALVPVLTAILQQVRARFDPRFQSLKKQLELDIWDAERSFAE